MNDYKLIIIDHEGEDEITLTHVGTIYDVLDSYDKLEEHDGYCLFHFTEERLTYKITQGVLNEYY